MPKQKPTNAERGLSDNTEMDMTVPVTLAAAKSLTAMAEAMGMDVPTLVIRFLEVGMAISEQWEELGARAESKGMSIADLLGYYADLGLFLDNEMDQGNRPGLLFPDGTSAPLSTQDE